MWGGGRRRRPGAARGSETGEATGHSPGRPGSTRVFLRCRGRGMGMRVCRREMMGALGGPRRLNLGPEDGEESEGVSRDDALEHFFAGAQEAERERCRRRWGWDPKLEAPVPSGESGLDSEWEVLHCVDHDQPACSCATPAKPSSRCEHKERGRAAGASDPVAPVPKRARRTLELGPYTPQKPHVRFLMKPRDNTIDSAGAGQGIDAMFPSRRRSSL